MGVGKEKLIIDIGDLIVGVYEIFFIWVINEIIVNIFK